MITDKQKQIAQWALNFALDNGCSDARISIIVGTNNSFEYRNTQLDKLQQSAECKLYIELFVDKRYGTFSTNRIEQNELKTFIGEGIASTRFLAEDAFRVLPNPSRYFTGNGKDLDLFDAQYDSVSTPDKIELIQQTADEVYQKHDRVVSVTASFDDGKSSEYMIASNGFESECSDSAFSLSAEVVLKGDNGARPESYWFDSTVYWNDLQKTGIASKALERALRKDGQKKVKSGRYNLLLDNTMSSRLLSPMISAMFGSALQQKNSFLLDKLGTKIASEKLTIYDRPHLKRTFGSRWFDGEGVATSDRTIIDKGMLSTYFIDTYHSLKMDVAPTIASPSVIAAELGNNDFEGLKRLMQNGIWVTGFNGGNSNPTTGDFSFGVEGFLIENGQISQPINEMNITGNLLSLWNNLEEVGNDLRKNASRKIPSLLFSDISFSGL